MTPQKTAPCCGLGWLAIVRAGVLPLYRTSQETPAVVGRTQLKTGLVTKDCMSHSAQLVGQGTTLIGLDVVQA